jgi:hypothetical protein
MTELLPFFASATPGTRLGSSFGHKIARNPWADATSVNRPTGLLYPELTNVDAVTCFVELMMSSCH